MLVIRQIRKGPRNCNWVLATLITWSKGYSEQWLVQKFKGKNKRIHWKQQVQTAFSRNREKERNRATSGSNEVRRTLMLLLQIEEVIAYFMLVEMFQ